MNVVRDFKVFLLKHGVVGLAIGVVLGAAVGKVVKSMVDDLVMPIIGFITPTGDWRSLVLPVGPVKFGIGNLLGNLLDFVIVALIAFLIIKYFVAEEKKEGDAPTR